MRTVVAEGECAGDLRSAGGLVLSIHKSLYRYSYQVSIFIYEVLVPKPGLAWNWKSQAHPLKRRGTKSCLCPYRPARPNQCGYL